jgi:hypothetical protein
MPPSAFMPTTAVF